jgi:hypothetical protein
VAEFKARFGSQAVAIDATGARSGRKPEELAYPPMVGRKSFWTVLLDQITAELPTSVQDHVYIKLGSSPFIC